MRFQELIEHLEYNPTRATLDDAALQYYIVPVDMGNLINIGFILVPVDDGVAVLPYTSVLPEGGFEQISLEDVCLLDSETAKFYLRLVENGISSLVAARQILEKVVNKCA